MQAQLEGHCYSRLRQSDDFREGVEALNTKHLNTKGSERTKPCAVSDLLVTSTYCYPAAALLDSRGEIIAIEESGVSLVAQGP